MTAEPFGLVQSVNPMIMRLSKIQSCIQSHQTLISRMEELLIYNTRDIPSLKTRIIVFIKHIPFHKFI